jgi:hypothetical protein
MVAVIQKEQMAMEFLLFLNFLCLTELNRAGTSLYTQIYDRSLDLQSSSSIPLNLSFIHSQLTTNPKPTRSKAPHHLQSSPFQQQRPTPTNHNSENSVEITTLSLEACSHQPTLFAKRDNDHVHR